MNQNQEGGRLYQKVAAEIAKRIYAEEFANDTRLPTERKLAELLHVSRPTVREALIALEIQGLIEIKGGSGSYVCGSPNSAVDLEMLFDVGHSPTEIIGTRLIFEVELAGRAALEAKDSDIEAIRAAVKKGWDDYDHHVARSKDMSDDADGQFHRAIAAASGNTLNANIVSHLWKGLRSPLIAALEQKADLEQYAELPLHDHERILRAIETKNESGAREAMKRHLLRYMKLLRL